MDEGGINSCNCAYCENYRLVRERIYPPEFRSMLDSLGIDYRKEVELDHITETDDENAPPYGQSVSGHYALVGRVLRRGDPNNNAAGDSPCFTFGISDGAQVHPVTRARFGKYSFELVDLNFWSPCVPSAKREPPR